MVNNDVKAEYQKFINIYLVGNSEWLTKSNSSIEFDFASFPSGKYMLQFNSAKGTVFYPGISDKDRAKIFEVKKGEITDVSFKISEKSF
jgi:hypothetical protein